MLAEGDLRPEIQNLQVDFVIFWLPDSAVIGETSLIWREGWC